MSDIIDSNELSTGDTKMEIDWVLHPFYLLHLSVVNLLCGI